MEQSLQEGLHRDTKRRSPIPQSSQGVTRDFEFYAYMDEKFATGGPSTKEVDKD